MARIKIPASRINGQADPALSKFFEVTVVDAATRPPTMRGDAEIPDELVELDIYLSLILNLAGLIPGFAANPFFEFFKAASIQLIKNRTKPDEVPGVEAMMPESPLVHLLIICVVSRVKPNWPLFRVINKATVCSPHCGTW
jgi:hypothetical protein